MDKEEIEWKIFKALGHQIRLKIVKKLMPKEKCVCEFVNDIEFSQSNLSQHLKILKEAGVLDSEKRGMNVVYSLKNSKIAEIINIIENI